MKVILPLLALILSAPQLGCAPEQEARAIEAMPAAGLDLDMQLVHISTCGITLPEGKTVSDLLAMAPRSEYEQKPYAKLLSVLGGEDPSAPGKPFSTAIWCLDLTSLDNEPAYAAIVERLVSLTSEEVTARDVLALPDFGKGAGGLTFDLQGKPRQVDMRVGETWRRKAAVIDVARMIERETKPKRFHACTIKEGMMLIGFGTAQDRIRINRVAAMPFVTLTEQ